MTLLRIAAFSEENAGGNPAGVFIADTLPSAQDMQRIAAEVGYSETAFAAPEGDGWRVRYFAPLVEVPFCGHATIALGAGLALQHGGGVFKLRLNNADITVEGNRKGEQLVAALQSPPTRSIAARPEDVIAALELFGLTEKDLDDRLPPAAIHGGADHLLLALKSRATLRAMHYDLARGQTFMRRLGLVTIALVHVEDSQTFNARNAFASGGVLEDPATGAAAAAFAGYLRDIGWPHRGCITIIQGEDMGMKSRIHADIPDVRGSSIRISGETRLLP
jgi:PhzF family phenazine biosynthesis protein